MANADLSTSISESAAGPRLVESDGQKVESHSLPDQIAADKYLASKNARKGKFKGLIFQKIVPPGAP